MIQEIRAVAQSGSALAWGARGREFESHRPDQFKPLVLSRLKKYTVRRFRTPTIKALLLVDGSLLLPALFLFPGKASYNHPIQQQHF